jgi:NAD(P)-dependent dehydrogenase (short-subunit alcohol dehydrogenase family)
MDINSKSIVITGSTRGIGLGLAAEFLKRGCQVTINGRSQTSVDFALELLKKEFESTNITGNPGDVSDLQTHRDLWNTAAEAFGRVDIWINNAGIAHSMMMIWELPEEIVQQLIDINLKGLIFGSQTAVQRMLEQGAGHIYNMEGFGSTGRKQAGLSLYGTSKAAVHYFSNALTAETNGTPVKVSTLSPGMVITDMILEQYEHDPQRLEDAKKIFNILADKVETVTPWLADQVLRNDKSGAEIRWLTTTKLMTRLATARFNKRDLFS